MITIVVTTGIMIATTMIAIIGAIHTTDTA
jgi:hypothetical protein